MKSLKCGECLDTSGDPIPWFSYPALHFLESCLTKNMKIFEFGSGNSTLYFAKRCKSVVSFENKEEWVFRTKKLTKNLENVEVFWRDGVSYFQPETEEKFDVVVVDGLHRNECCESAVMLLREGGVIILDNAERAEYDAGEKFLLGLGFKRLGFFGLAPLNHYAQDTSIFYREGNCFGI